MPAATGAAGQDADQRERRMVRGAVRLRAAAIGLPNRRHGGRGRQRDSVPVRRSRRRPGGHRSSATIATRPPARCAGCASLSRRREPEDERDLWPVRASGPRGYRGGRDRGLYLAVSAW